MLGELPFADLHHPAHSLRLDLPSTTRVLVQQVNAVLREGDCLHCGGSHSEVIVDCPLYWQHRYDYLEHLHPVPYTTTPDNEEYPLYGQG